MSKFFRLFLLSLAALGMLAAAVAATADDYRRRGSFVAFLDGLQEVPSVSTRANGSLYLRVDRSKGEIKFTLHTSQLEGELWQAHLHLGRSRTNGGVVAFLCGTVAMPLTIPANVPKCAPTSGGTVRGTIRASDILAVEAQGIEAGELDEVAKAIGGGAVYVNVHSGKFPSGEVRGQLR